MKIDYRDKRKPITAEDLIRGKGLNNLAEDRQSFARATQDLKNLEISIAQLKKYMSWQKLNEVTGDNLIDLSNSYNELLIITKANDKNYTIYIIKEEINSQESEFFYSSNCCWKTIVNADSSVSIKLESIVNESDISSAKTIVFYK